MKWKYEQDNGFIIFEFVFLLKLSPNDFQLKRILGMVQF